MAALALANAGWRVLFLGPDCPTPDMLAVTREIGAQTLALSVSAGFLTGTILQTDDSKVRYFLMPIALAASVRINSDVSTHFGALYTAVDGDADTQPEGTAIEGAVVVDFLQIWAMAEWRLSRVVAFTFTIRWVPYVSDVVLNATLDAGNPTLAAQIQGDLSELRNACRTTLRRARPFAVAVRT